MDKRRRKDGFTLVEMLVVLVIMALLAAVTIPSMTGFIKDTKKKAELSEARVVYMAAQAAISDYAAMYDEDAPAELASDTNHPIIIQMNQLINSDATGSYRVITNGHNKVTSIVYFGNHGTLTITESGVSVE